MSKQMSAARLTGRIPGETIMKIREFLQSQKFTQDEWQSSYNSWSRGGNGWQRLRSGGTNIHQALTWYQHFHKPGSKEWRPPIIIRALVAAVETDN